MFSVIGARFQVRLTDFLRNVVGKLTDFLRNVARMKFKILLEGKEGIGSSFLSHDKPKTETAKTIGTATTKRPSELAREST